MLAFLKMIPLFTLIGGAASNVPQLKEKYQKLMNYTKTVGIQTEVNNISKMIYLDSIEDEYLDKTKFSEYMRKRMKTKRNVTRDTSVDLFGTPYRYTTDKSGFTVTSAGADKKFDTDDDIYSGYDL